MPCMHLMPQVQLLPHSLHLITQPLDTYREQVIPSLPYLIEAVQPHQPRSLWRLRPLRNRLQQPSHAVRHLQPHAQRI